MLPLKESFTEKLSRCQVAGCPGNPRFSIHKLPQGTKKEKLELRRKWIQVLKLEPSTKAFYVCGNHFCPDDFSENVGKKCIRLKHNAVPSRNLNDSDHEQPSEVVAKLTELSLEEEKQSTCDTVKDAQPSNDQSVEEECLLSAEVDLDRLLEGYPDEESHETGKVDESTQTNLGYDDTLKEFTLIDMIKSDYQLNIMTGIPSFLTLENIAFCVDNLSSAAEQMMKFKASTKSLIIIVMFKLKTAMYFTQMAVFYRISALTVAKYFFEFVPILKAVLKCTVFWPSREAISANLPKCFKDKYSDCVAIMDCTECVIEKLKDLTSRIKSYSHYKGTHTFKVNIVVTPSAFVMQVSSAWGGKASDKHIVLAERVLDNFAENEAVMVDKGYNVSEECKAKGIKLYRPPILDTPQFTTTDAIETTSIARARIHVERSIQRMKQFQIFHKKFTKSTLKVIACAMINLSPPVLSNERF